MIYLIRDYFLRQYIYNGERRTNEIHIYESTRTYEYDICSGEMDTSNDLLCERKTDRVAYASGGQIVFQKTIICLSQLKHSLLPHENPYQQQTFHHPPIIAAREKIHIFKAYTLLP